MPSSPVVVVIKGEHYKDSEEVYGKYMEGSVPLLKKYHVGIPAIGNDFLTKDYLNAAWPVNIVLSFPNEDDLDGFFLDPDYLYIKEAYRDKAYKTIKISAFQANSPLNEKKDCVMISQSQLSKGSDEPLKEYLSGAKKIFEDYDVSVLASGSGIEKPYTTESWDVNTIVSYSNVSEADRFMNDPRYIELSKTRSLAYEKHEMTMFNTRAPRVDTDA